MVTMTYEQKLREKPKVGQILYASGEPVQMIATEEHDRPPVVWCKAAVTVIGGKAEWALTSDFHGINCVLLPTARDNAIKKYGIKNIKVSKLRVVKVLEKSILCELV